jgi:hypothetical protein
MNIRYNMEAIKQTHFLIEQESFKNHKQIRDDILFTLYYYVN